MVSTAPTRGMIEDLRESSNLVRTLSESFPTVAKFLKIITCRELIETPTMQLRDGKWKRTGPKEMMVTETSACLYLPNEERISIHENHSMIAKLGDGPESRYHAIKNHITSHARDAPRVIQQRQLMGECATALAETYQLAHFVYAVVCAVRSKSAPALQVEISVKNQLSFLENFAAFMLDDDLARTLEDPNLSMNHTQDVANSLRQLQAVFSSYRSLAFRFYKPYQEATNLQKPLKAVERYRTPGTPDISSSGALQDLASGDPLFEDQTLADVVRRCRESTRRLEITIAYVSLRSLLSPGVT